MILANLIGKSAMGGDAYGSIPAFPARPGNQLEFFLDGVRRWCLYRDVCH
jgi:hypothetical protein